MSSGVRVPRQFKADWDLFAESLRQDGESEEGIAEILEHCRAELAGDNRQLVIDWMADRASCLRPHRKPNVPRKAAAEDASIKQQGE